MARSRVACPSRRRATRRHRNLIDRPSSRGRYVKVAIFRRGDRKCRPSLTKSIRKSMPRLFHLDSDREIAVS